MKSEEVLKVIELLHKEYPKAKCSLEFSSPFELAIAVMLSAQCTDERVNKVTSKLFKEYNTPEDFKNIDIKVLEEYIFSCGFYKNKAKNIKLMASELVKEYNSKLPREIEKLIKIPGIGRKSANVIMMEAFGSAQGIAVDTHVKRLSNRIGLSKQQNPNKIEEDLVKIIPNKYYKDMNHLLIWHGRNCCTARKCKCEDCVIQKYCKKCGI